ncbi:MAG: DNA polymerase III subunit delta' [Gloeomargaritaceae cyanobacterium C42_A2020_066]|nr:DNA polymerase III subunit delta' [Gloeomargaritaceae cyanobacterium C42_A2020_066]
MVTPEAIEAAFAPLVGQTLVVTLLAQALLRDRLAPAYLIHGPAGIGKRVVARGLIQVLLGRPDNHPDLLWVSPTVKAKESGRLSFPQIRLEQVREIGPFVGRPPWQAPQSVVVIEDAQAMNEAAQDALLKTLEEPGRAVIILLADQASALLPTIRSRCQMLPCRRLSTAQMTQVLTTLGQTELLGRPDLLRLARGSPGVALSHWQFWQALPDDLVAALTQGQMSVAEALDTGRRIAQDLDAETQVWLVDYLQRYAWDTRHQIPTLSILEKAHQALLAYCQPRLVWEATLVALTQQ